MDLPSSIVRMHILHITYGQKRENLSFVLWTCYNFRWPSLLYLVSRSYWVVLSLLVFLCYAFIHSIVYIFLSLFSLSHYRSIFLCSLASLLTLSLSEAGSVSSVSISICILVHIACTSFSIFHVPCSILHCPRELCIV